MGKAKDFFVAMQCTECGVFNYRTRHKRKPGGVDKKLSLNKFCSKCRSVREHKEKRS